MKSFIQRGDTLTFVAPYAYTLELLMFWSDTSRFAACTLLPGIQSSSRK